MPQFPQIHIPIGDENCFAGSSINIEFLLYEPQRFKIYNPTYLDFTKCKAGLPRIIEFGGRAELIVTIYNNTDFLFKSFLWIEVNIRTYFICANSPFADFKVPHTLRSISLAKLFGESPPVFAYCYFRIPFQIH